MRINKAGAHSAKKIVSHMLLLHWETGAFAEDMKKPAKRRAASQVDVSDMFGTNPVYAGGVPRHPCLANGAHLRNMTHIMGS
jgi:hypothetical protein